MKFNKWFIFVFLCLFISTVSAQKTWEKPLNKWSKEDAMKILTDSPWAKTYQSTEGSSSASAQQAGREQSDVRMGGAERGSSSRSAGPMPVVIRLHSALPIRQAIVRLQQIEMGYDKMNETDRAKFDANRKGFLDCAICKNYYVVTITKFKDSSGQSVAEGVFQRMALKDMKGNITLVNDAGVSRDIFEFTPPKGDGDSAVFFFQRVDDKGEVLLTPQSKDLKFVFKNDFLSSSNPYSIFVPRNFEFKISKMMIGENLIF